MSLTSWARAAARRARTEAANIPIGAGRFFSLSNGGVIEPRLGLIVIGSGKCGTTSLHDWLGRHPDIFMSRPLKEPEYFAPPGFQSGNRLKGASQTDILRHMIAGYRRERVFGEASTFYTGPVAYDANPTPAIVHAYNPDMRLVYSIRNPLQRIVSHFNQEISKGRAETGGVIPEENFDRYLRAASYGRQLSHWAKVFPREQIAVVVLEEFSPDPRPMLNTLTDLLGLAPFPATTSFESRNVAAEKAVAPVPVCFTPEQFARATAQLLPDIAALETWLGRSVSDRWDLSADRWTAA